MTDLGCSSAPSLEGRRSIELVLQAPRPPSSLVLSTRIVLPRTHCHTRVPSVIASGSQEREPFLGIWYRRFQDFSTRQICWLTLLGGKLLETSPPTKCSDGSSMEYKWNSRRVFPLRRHLRCPNSSTRNADYSMYSTFLTASPGSVLFIRSALLKRKDLCFSCLRLGLIRHRRSKKPHTFFSKSSPHVDFALQDLLKGRNIGVYQDLAPGGEQFLSRSRFPTPPGTVNQCIVHALCRGNGQA
jgi:hypothetical protein